MYLPERFNLYKKLIYKYAKKYNIDPYLFTALIYQESGFQADVISSCGAIGLCQLMPSTAKGLGVNPYNVEENIKGGAMYLHNSFNIAKKKDYVNKDNLLDIILASYNAGWGACDKYRGVPPYAETQNYVINIKSIYKDLKQEYPNLFKNIEKKKKIKLFYHDGKINLIIDGEKQDLASIRMEIEVIE